MTAGTRRLLRAISANPKGLAGSIIMLGFIFLALFPGLVAKDSPTAIIYTPLQGPSGAHLIGTNSLGQDLFSQLVYGTRYSLEIAFVVGGLSTIVSVIVGVSAAFIGGVVDDILSFITDVLLVIPTFPLIIVLVAYTQNAGFWVLTTVLVVTGWSYCARQLRVQALSLRHRDFLESARVRGERKIYIIVFEILPTMTSLIVACFLGAALYAVLAAAGVSFIGLGDPNAISWGTMLNSAQQGNALGSGLWAWAIMPGVALALLGAAFALLNYASDELSNPALRPVRRRRRAGAGGVAVDVDLNLDLGTPSRHRRQAVRQAKRTRA
ncbi:MAG TPA: ABC transporter permease [Acidimicrobiales bacterium]|nr:ABC transporter permease [Acidimicrobiales bacterium]